MRKGYVLLHPRKEIQEIVAIEAAGNYVHRLTFLE
jgi:hypothetical protein